MRIVFLGNFGVDFSSESHHAKSLEALGHEVVRMQERVVNSEQVRAEALRSDIFVWVHTHGWITPGNMVAVLTELKEKGIPTLTYHLDLWFGLDRQIDLESDPFYKNIGNFFLTDKLMADWLNENTEVKGYYLPAGVFHEEAKMLPPTGGVRSKDVVFVGSRGYHKEWWYRPQLIDTLKIWYGDNFHHHSGEAESRGLRRGWDLNQLYADSKVVVGDSLCLKFNYPYYWSDRVYEVIGRGGFLIMPHIKGLEETFKNREHIVYYTFGDYYELKELIDYYLTHDEEREAIRAAGQELVKNHHTYKDRWQTILGTIGLV